jgi:hypothetical protein
MTPIGASAQTAPGAVRPATTTGRSAARMTRRDAPEQPAPRAEHDRASVAQTRELEHASGGTPLEYLSGSGHARLVGHRDSVAQSAPACGHRGVEPTL